MPNSIQIVTVIGANCDVLTPRQLVGFRLILHERSKRGV